MSFQVDETGFPQTEGLVRLYSEGVQDRNYYYAAFTAVQQCIGIAEAVKRQQPNQRFGNINHSINTWSIYIENTLEITCW